MALINDFNLDTFALDIAVLYCVDRISSGRW